MGPINHTPNFKDLIKNKDWEIDRIKDYKYGLIQVRMVNQVAKERYTDFVDKRYFTNLIKDFRPEEINKLEL